MQLHRHAGCGMMGRDGAMAALSHPSSFCHQTHNEWRPRQLNHHRHNVGYDHDDYDVSPYDHHDLRYTGGVLLLCGWGLWPAAGVRCCTCLPLLHARLHLSMMHLLLGDWAPPSWPWPRLSGCKCVWRERRGRERQGGMYLDTTTHNAIQQMYHQQTAQERIALRLTIPLPLLSSPSLSPSLSHGLALLSPHTFPPPLLPLGCRAWLSS